MRWVRNLYPSNCSIEAGLQPLLKRDHSIPGNLHPIVGPDRIDGKELGGQVKLVAGQGEACGPNPVRRLDLGRRQCLCHLGDAMHQLKAFIAWIGPAML
jgi:hypothetical protein